MLSESPLKIGIEQHDNYKTHAYICTIIGYKS